MRRSRYGCPRRSKTNWDMGFSFHLYWELVSPAREVAVTLEVLEPPSVDRLYFWALQASFLDGFRLAGCRASRPAVEPALPGPQAVNWGGYDTKGSVLPGSGSSLPSTPADSNTRDFPWLPQRRYMLRIFPSPENGWRGEVTDVETDVVTVVRDLHVGGDRLGHVVVWSELFCQCSDPRSVVGWSEPAAIGLRGEPLVPTGLPGQLQGRRLLQYQRLLRWSSDLPGHCQRADHEAGLADETLTQRATNTSRLNPRRITLMFGVRPTPSRMQPPQPAFGHVGRVW